MHETTMQEHFIIDILDGKKDGYYVELGAAGPDKGSNTYLLEKEYNWNGVSFEIEDKLRNEFIAERKNPCFGDALKFDYVKYFKENNYPEQIDFLQVDIDAGYTPDGRPKGSPHYSLHGLLAVPLNLYRFTLITFEHDANMYWRNNSIRDAQREILDSLGYSLVVRTNHEDWWVDPKVIDMVKFRQYYRWDVL